MADGGLLLPIFGGVAYTGPFTAMIAAERLLGLAARSRFAGSARSPSPSPRTQGGSRPRLRLTNAETKALDSMGHRWWRLAGMDEATARRRLYRLGEERYRDRLMLAWARAGGGVDLRAMARTRHLAGALERAEISAEGGRFRRARNCRRPRCSGMCSRWPKTRGWRRISRCEQAALKAIADQAVARFTRDHRL